MHLVHPKIKANIIPEEQRSSLSLGLSLSGTHTCPHLFMQSVTQDHATMWEQQLLGPTADGINSKGLNYNMKQKLWRLAFVWLC